MGREKEDQEKAMEWLLAAGNAILKWFSVPHKTHQNIPGARTIVPARRGDHTGLVMKKPLTALALATFLLLPAAVMAQGVGPQLIPESGMIGDCSFITGDFSYDCFPLYLAYLIRFVFGFAGGFALFELIRAGYEWAISGVAGEFATKETAVKRITNALIGMAVVVLAFLIIDTLVSAVFIGPS